MQAIRMLPAALALALTAGLAGCQGADDAQPETANQAIDPAEDGTLTLDGAHPGTVVALDKAFEVRLDGAEHALLVSPVDGELTLSWGGEMVNPEAELPEDIAAAVAAAKQVVGDPELLEELFYATPVAVELFKPIFSTCKPTGCSGQLCANTDIITTCEFRPEYACVNLTTCGPFGPGWSCAWNPTPAYLDCLADAGALPGPEQCGCETDSDCVKTTPGCCGCSNGGQEIAVAQQCLNTVPGCDFSDPGGIACSNAYFCTNREAICEAGECVLGPGGISF